MGVLVPGKYAGYEPQVRCTTIPVQKMAPGSCKSACRVRLEQPTKRPPDVSSIGASRLEVKLE